MKHLPRPKPYRPYKPVFVEYVKSVTPLDVSDDAVIKIANDLKIFIRNHKIKVDFKSTVCYT